MFSSDLLKGQAGIITGGSSGIGLYVAQYLSQLGAQVTICGRDQEKLAAAADTIDGEVHTASGDVRQREEVSAAVGSHMARFGQLDFLINNAAGNFVCPLAKMSENAFRSVYEIVAMGTFHFCQEAFPHMTQRQAGVIINTGTTYASTHGALVGHSGAAKAAVLNLTKTMAVEWGPLGIRANMVCPGPVKDTEGVRRLVQHEAIAKEMMEIMPISRMAEGKEIGALMAFLISPLGSYINGASIPIDGGLSLVNPGLLPPSAMRMSVQR